MKIKIIDKDETEYTSLMKLCEAHNINYSSVRPYAQRHSTSFIDALYILKK